MTRLPSDSFLPSGALNSELYLLSNGFGSQASSSVVSPLALPPSRAQHYYDGLRPSVTSHPHGNAYTNHITVYPKPNGNGNSHGPPQAQPASFLSPHLTPIPSQAQYQLQLQHQQQQRSASLSPTRSRSSGRRDVAMDRSRPAQALASSSGPGRGFRSPSVEPAHIDAARVRRLESQCKHLKQAWEDERKHLQADRNRAEEVYKEDMNMVEQERDQERAEWEEEKAQLQMQIRLLQERLEQVEAHGAGRNAPSLEEGRPAISQTSAHDTQLPVRIRPDITRSSSREECDLNTYDPKTAMEPLEPSVIVDVQEYHADLEGIPIKANAVKKATFTDTPSPSSSGSKPSSGKSSPPSDADTAKLSAKERTLEVINADPKRRLTMNAGHTPTVSMSAVPSNLGTSVVNTAGSTGSNTPTCVVGDCSFSVNDTPIKSGGQEPVEPRPSVTTATAVGHPEATLEPSEADRELKGPLMVRNIPAKDEVFFKRLNDKLEKIESGEDAVPAVLKKEDEAESFKEAAASQGETSSTLRGGDGSSDSEEAVEGEIPLKLKRSNNFGAPLGFL